MHVLCADIILQKVLKFIVKRHGMLLLVVKASSLWSSILLMWYRTDVSVAVMYNLSVTTAR